MKNRHSNIPDVDWSGIQFFSRANNKKGCLEQGNLLDFQELLIIEKSQFLHTIQE